MYDYKVEDSSYEKYRDNTLLFEIKKHTVKNYYAHFHYATEICCVRKGEFYFKINGQKKHATAGDVVYFNPGEIHQYYENDDCEVIIAIMSKEYSDDLKVDYKDSYFENLLTNHEVNSKVIGMFDDY